MGYRAVLSMGQTDIEDRPLPGNFRKRRSNSNHDRADRLSVAALGRLLPRCSAHGGSGDAPHIAAQGSSAAPGKPSGGAASGTPDSVNLGGLPIPWDLGSGTGRNRPGIDGPGVGQVTGQVQRNSGLAGSHILASYWKR